MPDTIAALAAQQAELSAQLEGARAALAQLEALVNLSDAEKEALKQTAEALSALEAQRDQLQAQLDAMGDAPVEALERQLADARKAREEQVALRAAQQKYIEDLQLLDADALRETIARLEEEIAANEAELSDVRSGLEAAIGARDAAQREVGELSARIAELEAAQPTATAEPTSTCLLYTSGAECGAGDARLQARLPGAAQERSGGSARGRGGSAQKAQPGHAAGRRAGVVELHFRGAGHARPDLIAAGFYKIRF